MRRRLPILLLLALLAVAPATMAHAAVSRPAPRILGGNPVTPATAFGPMAAIVVRAALSDTGVSCGGTVIAPYAVLTAAHCFEVPTQGTPAQLMVVTGKADLAAPGGQHLDIRAIVTHPQFVHTRLLMTDDVAVVLLQTPTTAPSAIRSTSTPQLGSGTVYGWGALDAAKTLFPPTLQTASLAIQPPSSCTNFFASAICAGVTTPNICEGDSGGPFLVSTPAGERLAGVTSGFITTCGTSASAFTDVSLFTNWIDAQLVPTVSQVTVTALSPTAVRVAWQVVPGGAAPTATVTTTNAPATLHAVPAGATSLDIVGLPAKTPIGASVHVANTWGSAQATSAGTVTLSGVPGAPSISGAAVTNAAIGAQVSTSGAPVTVRAQYGLDTVHLTDTAGRQVADAATAQRVSIALPGLLPARSYRARLIAQSAGGTATSPWLVFSTPAVKPASRSLPRLRGTARVGKTLTCTVGAWRGAPAPRFTFRWRIGTKLSSRFTTSRLRLTTPMRGRKVACVVTARNVAGSVTVRSGAVTVRRP